jgi:MerR family transcriptional regulator, copper efflux regulator
LSVCLCCFDNKIVKTIDDGGFFRQYICRKVPTMTLRELTLLTGLAERQIRYLIAEGLMPAPRGGRAHADYGDDHVAAIRRYTTLRHSGLLPSAIKLLLENPASVPFPVAPGIALHVDPSVLGQGRDVTALIDRLRTVLEDLFQETTDAPAVPIDPGDKTS